MNKNVTVTLGASFVVIFGGSELSQPHRSLFFKFDGYTGPIEPTRHQDKPIVLNDRCHPIVNLIISIQSLGGKEDALSKEG